MQNHEPPTIFLHDTCRNVVSCYHLILMNFKVISSANKRNTGKNLCPRRKGKENQHLSPIYILCYLRWFSQLKVWKFLRPNVLSAQLSFTKIPTYFSVDKSISTWTKGLCLKFHWVRYWIILEGFSPFVSMTRHPTNFGPCFWLMTIKTYMKTYIIFSDLLQSPASEV